MQKNENNIEKYDWDLSLILPDDESFFALLDSMNEELKALELYQGKLNTRENIVEYIKASKSLEKKISRVYLYASLKYSQNSLSAENEQLMERAQSFCVRVSSVLSFAEPELANLPNEFLESLKTDKTLADYSRIFGGILRNKPHTLSPVEEKIFAGLGSFTDYQNTFDMLSDNEMKFGNITLPSGESVELTHASYGKLVENSDAGVREQAHLQLRKVYKDFNKTISANYINELKLSDFTAKSYHFNSAFDSSLFYEEVEPSVYHSLISAVNENIKEYIRYTKLKAKALGKNEFSISDARAGLGCGDEFKLDYDEAYRVVVESLSCLGEDYCKVLNKAHDNRWIDVYPKEGKCSGAFSTSEGTGNPFVLLNYDKTYNDISTIAHEMGHAMHSYLTEKGQPYEKSGYVIFLAEIASTVNEILLNRCLFKNAKSKEAKLFLLDSLLETFYATVFRQTMFSEFEYEAHGIVNRDEPISSELLNNLYQGLLEKYFGKDTKIHQFSKYEWSYVPHFYRPFYVFKYATGFISAIAIVQKIEKEGESAVQNYLKFLSSGCSSDPISLLKIAGVDITDKKTFEQAFDFYKNLIDELGELV